MGQYISDCFHNQTGDCWFLAAVATISSVPGLLEKICVARDEGMVLVCAVVILSGLIIGSCWCLWVYLHAGYALSSRIRSFRALTIIFYRW